MSDLPPGFTLEEDNTGLPAGFTLEPAASSADIEKAAALRREVSMLPRMRPGVRPSEEAAMLAADRERTTALGQAQLLERGVRIGEAPMQARIKSGLGLNRLQGYRSALGPDFEVEELQTEGPYKGEIIFRRKGEQQWQTVRQPEGFMQPLDVGARYRDIRSLEESALPEIMGGIGGAVGAGMRARIPGFRNPVITAVLGAATLRLPFEMRRLERGQQQGVVPKDLSASDIFVAALNETWPQALGEGAGVALYSLMRMGAARGMPDLSGITPQQFEAAAQEARRRAGQAGSQTLTVGDIFAVMSDPQVAQRIKVSPNSAQALASFFKTAEDKIAATVRIPQQRTFQERAIQRERAAGEMLAAELPEGPGGVAPNVRAMGQAVEAAAPGVEEAQGMLRAVAPTPPVSAQDLGERVTEAIKTAERTQQRVVKDVYNRIAGDASAVVSPAEETGKVIESLSEDFKTRIFPALTSDTKKLVAEGLNSLFRTRELGFMPDSEFTFPPARELTDITFDQYAKAITDIRAAIRKAYKGDWDGPIPQLSDIEDALVADRAKLLSRLPNGQQLINELDAADADWARLKNVFRRAKVAEAFRINPKMARAETAEDFVESVSMNAETAQAVLPYLAAREKEELRGMLALQLSELARSYGKGREIRQSVLERAINNPDSAVGVLFTPAERAQLTNAARLQDLRQAIGIPNQGRLEDWFNNFYETKSITQAESVFRRLQLNPANAPVADAIRGMMRMRLYDDLTTKGPQGGNILDTDKLTAMLKDPKQAQWLVATLGPSFAGRMRMVAESTQTMFPNVPRLNMGDEPLGPTGAYQDIKRLGRAFIGVLRPESRALTYVMETARGEMRDRIARAVLDPEYFQRIMTRARNTAGGRATAATIGGILKEEDLADPSGKTWASDLPGKWSENISNMIGAKQ